MFEDFYRSTYRGVVAQVFAYTGDMGEAQEVAQEAFVRAWARWSKVSAYDQPRAWVCRVAYQVAISRWRKARTAFRALSRHGPPDRVPEPDAVSHDLVLALRRLPEAQRRAVVMYHLGDLSVAEIAAAENVPAGTIKARLSRGRAALAELLADRAGMEGSTHA